MKKSHKYSLSLSCPDRAGIVAAISSVLAEAGLNILESRQFGDPETGRFFMRVGFEGEIELAAARALFEAPAQKFDMQWELCDAEHRPRVVLLVSKFDHCLILSGAAKLCAPKITALANTNCLLVIFIRLTSVKTSYCFFFVAIGLVGSNSGSAPGI